MPSISFCTCAEYVSGLTFPTNRGKLFSRSVFVKLDVHALTSYAHAQTHCSIYNKKSQLSHDCYCLRFITNQSKIYCSCSKKKDKIRMPLFIHIVSYVVKIYICHLAKVLKGCYTNTVRNVNILEIIGTTQNCFVIT